jgi:hypothetical protein
MKKERILFLTVLFAAGQALAQQQVNTNSTSQTNNPSASTTLKAPKPTFHWFGPGEPVQTGKNPRYVEGLDTRAWTTVAEDDSRKSAFPDGETHEAGLCVVWWGAEPRSR